jgi:hypothetical protein
MFSRRTCSEDNYPCMDQQYMFIIQWLNSIQRMLRVWAKESSSQLLQADSKVWRQNCATQDATWDEWVFGPSLVYNPWARFDEIDQSYGTKFFEFRPTLNPIPSIKWPLSNDLVDKIWKAWRMESQNIWSARGSTITPTFIVHNDKSTNNELGLKSFDVATSYSVIMLGLGVTKV